MTRIGVAFLLGTLIACGTRPAREADAPRRAAASKGAAPGPADGHGDSDTIVRIADDMLRDLRLTTAVVEARTGGEGAPVLGELHVDEEHYAEVSSALPAKAVRLRATPGDRVAVGTPLVELASIELGKARGALREAEARRALAVQALARKRGLAEERIVPQREVQEADAEAQAAEAALAAARATLESLGIGVEGGDGGRFFLKAPVNGTVLDRQVVQGQVVEPGRVLFKIGDLARLWLVAHASERDALQVRVGSAARVAYPALPGQPFEARVSLVGRIVDAGSRTIPVRLLVANTDDRLRPGMSATVWLPVGDEGRHLTVPAASLQRLHDSWCVFVPRGEGRFDARRVGRGRDLGGEVEILSGLAAGETVVVEGAFLLKAEGEKAESEGGHHDH
jgi:membrane fusion protein, heavy metal efflux system